jgi:urease accessory protein
MEIIHAAAPLADATSSPTRLAVDRLTLAKRRWRGIAEDGREFGFDLTAPLHDGDTFLAADGVGYVLSQKYEPVLELRIADWLAQEPATTCPGRHRLGGLRSGPDAARLGWMIGNLHFQLEITEDVVRVADDPALRQLFEREGLHFTTCKRVFHPLSGGHHH